MLEEVIQRLGYPAIVLGTFVEGEVSILVACYLAMRGYLHIQGVVLAAFLGTFASDQLWYLLGKHHGHRILARGRHWRTLESKAQALLALHPDLWVLCFRFFWGMRTVMPVVIGLSRYSWRRYLLLDAVGAIAWSVALALISYQLGYALDVVLANLQFYQLSLLAVSVALGLLLWWYRRHKRK